MHRRWGLCSIGMGPLESTDEQGYSNVATTNLFLNPYEQSENKLTYSFLSLLEHLSLETACTFLSKLGIVASRARSLAVSLLYGGGEGNPDGSVHLEGGANDVTVFFENKTWRSGLKLEQLRRHLAEHVDTQPGTLLLVITSEREDKKRITDMADPRLRFATWHQVAEAVEDLAGSVTEAKERFLLSQFAEYLEKSGEARRARMLGKELINCLGRREESENEVVSLLNSLKDDIQETFKEEIDDFWGPPRDRWGRISTECSLHQAPLEQWVGFGVYYGPSDHKIPLKMKYQPEFAVFFDMKPGNRRRLSGATGIQAAIGKLKSEGYEFNFPDARYNAWRICFWRGAMMKHIDADVGDIRKMFEHQLRVLFQSRFYQIAKNISSK